MDFEALHQAADALERQAHVIRAAREEHDHMMFRASSEAGQVTATCRGNGTVTGVAIKDGALNGSRPETIAAEVKEAILNARAQASASAMEAFRAVAPELAGE